MLETGRRVYISQSGVILHHLANVSGNFHAKTAAKSQETWRFIFYDNHKFTGNFPMLRHLCGIEKTGETPITEYLRARVRRAWKVVEEHLSNWAFLLGDRPAIADFSLAGCQFYCEPTGINGAEESPNIEAWTNRMSALSGWWPPDEVLPRP